MSNQLSESKLDSETSPFADFRSAAVLMASDGGCRYCYGLGWRYYARLSPANLETEKPCGCALASAFGSVLARYRYIQANQGWMSGCMPLLVAGGGRRKVSWGRKHEEYCADFHLVSRRHLNDSEWRLFDLYFLNRCGWRESSHRLGMSRGSFFNATDKIKRRLGLVFMTLRPYPLYPVGRYFEGAV